MLVRPILLALVVLSCTSTPSARVASAPAPAPRIPRGSDPSGRFFTAYERAQQKDVKGALELLEALDREGWNVPLDPIDWPALSGDSAFQAVSARIGARMPRTPHAPVAFTIAEPGLIPEGITADPVTGALYVGSIRQRRIVRIAPDGAATDFVPSGAHGLLAPLGLKIDPERRLLWAGSMTSKGMVGYDPNLGDRAALFAFDLATGAPRRMIPAPAGEHLLNDLAIAADGTVYVTDSTAGAVWKLPPDGQELVAVVPGGFAYSNGLVLLAEHQLLVVCDALGMTLVPLDGRALRPVEGPPGVPLGGIDGLSLDGTGALIGVQNSLGSPRLIRVRLDVRAARATPVDILEAGNPEWHIPTTGTVLGDTLLYVGNAHLDGISEKGLTPEAAAAPTKLFRLPLPR